MTKGVRGNQNVSESKIGQKALIAKVRQEDNVYSPMVTRAEAEQWLGSKHLQEVQKGNIPDLGREEPRAGLSSESAHPKINQQFDENVQTPFP